MKPLQDRLRAWWQAPLTPRAPAWRVRPAQVADVPTLLQLMRSLAEFEQYARDFAVTEEILLRQGFERPDPHFHALVAEHDDQGVQGMLVYYFVPFTFRAHPTLYVKELFVNDVWRSHGLGQMLMRAAARVALVEGCAMMRWQVARWNADGARFYERLGAVADDVWVDYGLDVGAISALALRK